MVAARGVEDLPLAAGRVVLGQPGDLVEQLAAAVVVEPLRRQPLRLGGEAPAHVGAERVGQVVGSEVDVDGDGQDSRQGGLRSGDSGRRDRSGVGGEAETGERPAGGRREEVAVGRPGVARRGDARAAAQHHLVAHELAVVLTDRAGRRLEAGVGQVGARRSTPRPRARLAEAGRWRRGRWGAGAARADRSRRRRRGTGRPPPTRTRSAAGHRPRGRRRRPRSS